MKTVCVLKTYKIAPSADKRHGFDAIEQDNLATFASVDASYPGSVVVTYQDSVANVLADQISKAVTNAMNSVRGCMEVQSLLDTFEEAPMTYDARQKNKRTGNSLQISSSEILQFVRVVMPNGISYCVIGEQLRAATKNLK